MHQDIGILFVFKPTYVTLYLIFVVDLMPLAYSEPPLPTFTTAPAAPPMQIAPTAVVMPQAISTNSIIYAKRANSSEIAIMLMT